MPWISDPTNPFLPPYWVADPAPAAPAGGGVLDGNGNPAEPGQPAGSYKIYDTGLDAWVYTDDFGNIVGFPGGAAPSSQPPGGSGGSSIPRTDIITRPDGSMALIDSATGAVIQELAPPQSQQPNTQWIPGVGLVAIDPNTGQPTVTMPDPTAGQPNTDWIPGVGLVAIDPRTGQPSVLMPDPTAGQAAANAAADRASREAIAAQQAGASMAAAQLQAETQRREGAANRALQGTTTAGGWAFQGAEGELDRGLQAAQFAATFGLDKARFGLDERRAALEAAQSFANNVSNTDPAALPAFLAAGGGNISNALSHGASAISDAALLPASRMLGEARRPAAVLPNFSYSGGSNPFSAAFQNYVGTLPGGWNSFFGTLLGGGGGGAGAGEYAPGGTTNVNPPATRAQANAPQPIVASNGTTAVNFQQQTPEWQAAYNQMGLNPVIAAADGFRGTVSQPTTFLVGEDGPEDVAVTPLSTSASTIPYGNDNINTAYPTTTTTTAAPAPRPPSADDLYEAQRTAARTSGVQYTGSGGIRPGTVAPSTPAAQPAGGSGGLGLAGTFLGGMYGDSALGITAADRALMDEVMRLRQGVQYPNLNPFSTQFFRQSPTMRETFFKGRQARYGVPLADQLFEAQRYALPGIGRNQFSQGL